MKVENATGVRACDMANFPDRYIARRDPILFV